LNDDGYKWVAASYYVQLEISKQLSMETDKTYEWWYENLDAFYSVAFEKKENEVILNMRIKDVANLLEFTVDHGIFN